MMGRVRDIAPLPGAREGAEALERADRKAYTRQGLILVGSWAALLAAVTLAGEIFRDVPVSFTFPEAVLVAGVILVGASGTAIVTATMWVEVSLRRMDRRLADLDGRVARVEGLVERGGRFGAADAPEPAPAGD